MQTKIKLFNENSVRTVWNADEEFNLSWGTICTLITRQSEEITEDD